MSTAGLIATTAAVAAEASLNVTMGQIVFHEANARSGAIHKGAGVWGWRRILDGVNIGQNGR